MRLAIVGSGIAGLSCAHVLGPQSDVTLFEADDRLGGHANTVMVEDPVAGWLAVDTGFIVHNERNYPNLTRLFSELGVPVQPTEMSFAVTDRNFRGQGEVFTYRASNLATLFADRRNLMRADMWRMLAEITRFYRSANRFLRRSEADPGRADGTTLAEFLADGRYSQVFVDQHLIPLGASVWSADPRTFAAHPAAALFRFLSNHGLLGLRDRPRWLTVVGGSQRYVAALVESFGGDVRPGSRVSSIERDEQGVTVRTEATSERFDEVVLACHSDQALEVLADASAAEKEILGAIRYQTNRATLHTDVSVLSPHRDVWAAWNYERPRKGIDPEGLATVTYDLTNLQRLPGSRRYLVSLNSDHRIDPSSVIAGFDYAHPVFDSAALAAQSRRGEISGVNRTHFCGAYWGYGFHEDGIDAALRVCSDLGVDW